MAKEVESAARAEAPTSGDSATSAEGQKRRRRRRLVNTTDGHPSEEVTSVSNERTLTKGVLRSARKGAKNELTGRGTNNNSGSGSVLFTILIIGLIFSLIDVVYVIGFVHRQNLGESTPDRTKLPPEMARQPNSPNQSPPKQLVDVDHLPNGQKLDSGDRLFGDKSNLVSLLTRAGFVIDPVKDKELVDDLPTWSEVVGMYGSDPVVYGLDRCQQFQLQSDPAMHFLGVAGTFNTGTNLLAELLIANCHMQARMDKFGSENRGIRWQVPWGKHTPPGDEDFRQHHKTDKDKPIDANNILAAVTIRDPLFWLGSMCRHPYAADWDQGDEDRCPNFSLPDLRTTVQYAAFEKKHESILHLWNSYYQEYLQGSFPRLIVRYEDLIFHPEEVTTTVCECAGGSMRNDGTFQYIVDSAKKGEGAHGKTRTGFADALVKYGNEKLRYQIYRHASDLEYVMNNVDAQLMKLMKYPYPDPSKANS